MNSKKIGILLITLLLFLTACNRREFSSPSKTATNSTFTTPTQNVLEKTTPQIESQETATIQPVEIIDFYNAVDVSQKARLGNGNIRQFDYSQNGDYFAIATDIGYYIYETNTYKLIDFFETPAIVLTISFSPDGKKLAYGMINNTIDLVTVNGKLLLQIKPDERQFSNLQSVMFSPDGKRIVGWFNFGGLGLWDASDGSLIMSINETDQSLLLNIFAYSSQGDFIVTGNGANYAQKWNASTGTLLRSYGQFEDNIIGLAISPDDTLLATSVLWKSDIQISKISDGSEVINLKGNSYSYSYITFSPDGNTLFARGYDGEVIAWNLNNGSNISLKIPDSVAMIMSPKGENLVVIKSGSIEFWQLHPQRLLKKLEGVWSQVRNLGISPDGAFIAGAYWDGKTRVWSTNDQKITYTFAVPTGEVESVTFSPDGKNIAVGATYGSIQIWDANKGTLEEIIDYNLYNLDLELYHFHIPSIIYSPDGTMLISGIVWVGNDGNSFSNIVFMDSSSGEVIKGIPSGNWVYSLSSSPDGKFLASQESGSVRVFKVEEALTSDGIGILFYTQNNAYPGSPATIFSPDNRYLAMSAFSICLYDRENDFAFISGLGDSSMHVQSLSFSPDSQLLISGGGDNSIYIWNVKEQNMLNQLNTHNSLVSSVAFAPDGSWFASSSWDGTIRIWAIP